MTVKRRANRPLQVLLTPFEHATVQRIASERGMTLRDLVVSAVLGSEPTDMLQRVLDLEARVLALEAKR